MKKMVSIVLALMMLLALTSACSSNDQPVADNPPQNNPPVNTPSDSAEKCTVATDSDIVVLHYSEVSSLFPPDQTTVAEGFPTALVYECPLKADADGSLVWVLAESCDVSEDMLTYTFHLRKGISFSDGTPWNAEAMKANFDIRIDPNHAFKGVSSYTGVTSSTALDEYTCQVTVGEPDAAFLTKLANNGYMISPSLIYGDESTWGTTMIGTGQYQLTDYKSGESMSFALNRDWWGYDAELCGGTALAASNVGFNTITVKPVSEEATRIAMLMAGQADVIHSVSTINTPTIEGAGLKTITRISTLVGYMNFNCQKEYLQDVRVRHALAMAVDVDAMNKVVYGGANVRARSVSADSINYFVPQEPYDYDPEAARELLKEAGYGDGLNLILWSENDNTDIARAEFIQQQLGEIGVTVEVKCMEGGALTSAFEAVPPEELEWDLYIRGYSASNGDASLALGRFHSDKFYPVGANYAFWSNAEFDEYIEKGGSTIDPDERLAAYTEAQRIIWEELPAYPLLINTSRAGISNRVDGVSFKNNGNVDLSQAVYIG